MAVTIVFLIVIVFGATYACFQASISKGTSSNIRVQTGTTDSLVFETDDAISISATQQYFGKDGTSLSGSAKAREILKSTRRL